MASNDKRAQGKPDQTVGGSAQSPARAFVVRGTVLRANGNAVRGLIVRAAAQRVGGETPLGEAATTNSRGHYEISYDPPRAVPNARAAKRGVDLVVRAFDRKGTELVASPIRFGAQSIETIDLRLPATAADRAPSEVERLAAAIIPALDGVPLASLTPDDVEFVARRTGEDAERVALLASAARLSESTAPPPRPTQTNVKPSAGPSLGTPAVPRDAFYGWFRQGISTDPDAFWGTPDDALARALAASIAEHVVPESLGRRASAIAKAVQSFRADRVLRPSADGRATSLGDLLATMPRALSAAKTRALAAALQDAPADDAELAARLRRAKFNAAEIVDVRVTRALGDLTDGHPPLVAQLQTLRPDDGDDGSLRFLASRTPLQWLELADAHGVPPSLPPDPVAYAAQLERAVDAAHPTAVFAARVRDGALEVRDPAVRDAAAFLAEHPALELTRESARAYVGRALGDDDGTVRPEDEPLVAAIERVQRARKLTDGWQEAGTLLNTGLYSAADIVGHDAESFVAAVATGITPARAREIYEDAIAVHDTTIAIIGTVLGTVIPAAVSSAPASGPVVTPGKLDGYPSLRRLFGSLDACECRHCESVLGPAAYLVDLLRFLDPPVSGTGNSFRAALGAPLGGAMGSTPLMTLLARRPDVADLELTCANTDTEIPYVDLVLELLENALALPLDVPAPFGFDPPADFAQTPLAANVDRALRAVLARTSATIGPRLTVRPSPTQLLIGNHRDWIATDGSRTWVLRHWPQALSVSFVPPELKILGFPVQVDDYAAAVAALDQGTLPNASWLVPDGDGPRDANLPLAGTPTVTVAQAGRRWTVSYRRAVRVQVVMGARMGEATLKDVQGQQLDAVRTTRGVLQMLVDALVGGWIAEPVESLLPSGLDYEITAVGNDWEIAYTNVATLSYAASRLSITSLGYQCTGAEQDLKASAANRNPEAYERLAAADYPWSLPFDLWTAEVRAFLDRCGVPRRRLMEECDPASRLLDEPAADPVARETLGISHAEAAIIAPTTASATPWSYWGLDETGNSVVDPSDDSTVSGSWLALLGRVSILLHRAGLTYGELLDVLDTRFVRAVSPALSPSGGCDTSAMTLAGLTAPHLDRIHRFVRLARALGWSFHDLDRAIAAVTASGMALTAQTLRGLAHLRRLHDLLGVPVGTIAGWWGTLVTDAPIDHAAGRRVAARSVYESLFQGRAASSPPDPDLALDRLPSTTATPADKAAPIGAALGMRAADVVALADEVTTGSPPALSLPNLVALYRHRSVARALGLTTSDHLRALSLIDDDPFRSPAALVTFVEAVRFVQADRLALGFDEIEYLLLHTTDAGPSPLLDARWAERTLAGVRDAIQAVQRDLPNDALPAAERLRALLGRLGWYDALVGEAVALLASDAEFTVALPSGGADPDVDVPAALAEWVAYEPDSRRLTIRGTLTVAEWAALAAANAANGQSVADAIDALKADADAFVAALPAIRHRVQSLALPTHRVTYTGAAAPAIPAALRPRVYHDSAADTIALVGWMTDDEERQLTGALPAADVQGLRASSDAYAEAAPLNAFVSLAGLRALFARGETPETRAAAIVTLAAPWLAREAVVETLAPALGIEPPVARDLLLRQLDRATTLDSLLASAFAASDPRTTVTAAAFGAQHVALGKLHKAALLLARAEVRAAELPWLPAASPAATDPATFDVLALNALPVAPGDTPASFDALRRWLHLVALRDTSRLGAPFLAGVLAGVDANDETAVQSDLATRLDVPLDDVTAADAELALAWPDDYLDPSRLTQLTDLLRSIRALGASAEVALALAGPAPNAADAGLARGLLRARTDAASWPRVLEPIENGLRDRRRAALVDRLVARDGLRDAAALYDRYLVDVEMSTCRTSTRILLAISAVQLFVQRCLLNLEPDVSPARIDAERWRWMKSYRVWEANRKVFLYPENWIEPELRDDKSEIFTALEGELLQQELDAERAEEILKGYLKQLEDLSRLSIVGTYLERQFLPDGQPAGAVVHFVGRTHNRPSRFFHRRWLLSPTVSRWTPWERVPLDGVKTDHVLPFVMRGDVYVAWPEITQLPAETDATDTTAAGPRWRLQLAWTRRTSRGWSDRYLCTETIEHPWVVGKDEHQSFAFRIRERLADATDIECYGAARDGTLSYAAPSLADVAPFRINLPIPSTGPWVRISFSGSVWGSYQGGTVFRPVQGATVKATLVFTGGSQDDLYWGPLDRERDLTSNALRLYVNDDSDVGLTFANGTFSLNLALVTLPPHFGFWTPRLLNCNPEFRLEITHPDGRTQSTTFPYFDPQTGRALYSEERFQKNFVFAMSGTAPGAEADRPVEMRPLRVYRLLAGEDARLMTFSPPPLTVPNGTQSYASGYRAVGASLSSALAVPGSTGLTLWTGVAPRYFLLPNAPASYDGMPDVLVYADENDSYVIRREDDATDPAGGQGKYQVLLHGHPTAGDLRRLLANGGIPALYALAQQTWTAPAAAHTLATSIDAGRSLVAPAIRFEPDEAESPYAGYNTELFFHVPVLVAAFLADNQRFADALDWLHLVFDPTTSEVPNAAAPAARYWRYAPFRQHAQTDPVDVLLAVLANPNVSDADPKKVAVHRQIETWLENPFRPHAVARLRPRAYQLTVVFAYLDTLIAWGDQLFRRATTESINEATQLYLLAARLLGPRPRTIPRATRSTPLTYRATRNWDAFANAWVEVEANLGAAPGATTGSVVQPGGRLGRTGGTKPIKKRHPGLNTITTVGMPYFCVPTNPKLGEYWDTLESRLFNIRHCRNIDGVEQRIPLFQPPIDPALLVRAAAAGLDLDTVLADASGPPPHYRFSVMAQKATELCGEVRALGAALLTALEKKDAEHLAVLRSGHELEMLDLVRNVREQQIAEAKANVVALRQSEATAAARFRQYQTLLGKPNATVSDDPGADVEQTSAVRPANAEPSGDLATLGLTQAEQDQMAWSEIAIRLGVTAGVHSTLASIFFAIPQIHAGSPVFHAEFGGQNLGHLMNAGGAFWTTLERAASYKASRAGAVGGYQRRQDEWVYQSRIALREVQQVRRQIVAAEIRQAITEQELRNHDQQAKNARAADEFMRDKYTNAALYQWMAGQVSAVYFQAYQLALDVARRAERAFRHELGAADASFVRAGHWDTLKKGLMAGDRLAHDVKRMEVAYLDQNRREYEITKHVSVRQLDPAALVALRETGTCEVAIPEALFDLDFAGHYLRRIRTVSLTIPCVTGPYVGVPCTLTLLGSSVRRTNVVGRTYARDVQSGDDDPRFVDLFGATQSIVTSGAQADGGLFEPSLRDDRFLPFEGAGAISSWRLTLPTAFPAFDYDTITDVVLHLRYTARDGGAALKQKAEGELQAAVNAIVSEASAGEGLCRIFSLRREFATEWHRFTATAAAGGTGAQTFALDRSRFPFLLGRRPITVTRTTLYAVPGRDVRNATFPALTVTLPGETAVAAMTDASPVGRLSGKTIGDEVAVGARESDALWTLAVPIADIAALRRDVDDVLVLCQYRIG